MLSKVRKMIRETPSLQKQLSTWLTTGSDAMVARRTSAPNVTLSHTIPVRHVIRTMLLSAGSVKSS